MIKKASTAPINPDNTNRASSGSASSESVMAAYGLTNDVLMRFEVEAPPGTKPGRVVRVDRSRVLVATESGVESALPYSLAGRRIGFDGVPSTGDWVATGHTEDEGLVVLGLLERTSVIERKRALEQAIDSQVIAANVDLVAIVVPLDTDLNENRLERTLTVAWESGATPLIVLSKTDVATDPAAAAEAASGASAGADVVVTSAETGAGIDELRSYIVSGATVVFFGPSGAGKSTLINALIGEDVQDTGEVRAADGRGRHTTTARELIPLPGGAVLIDTPGIRSLGLWDSGNGISASFGDVEALAGECRFNDCAHDREPGCAVRAALETGELPERRWASYRKLQRELRFLEGKKDEHVRRDRAREFHKHVRQANAGKPRKR